MTDREVLLLRRKLDLLLRTGKLLMESAADTNRIERNMKRVAAFMGIPEEKLHLDIRWTMIMVNVSDRLVDEIRKRIDNGRNKGIEFIPAKLEAYRALACSASIPVTDPDGVLVVDDCFTHFKDHVIVLDDGASGEPTMVEDMEHDCELCASDGFGLISYDLAQQWSEDLKLPATASGFCVRNAFCKGIWHDCD